MSEVDERILILTSTRRDADSTQKLLAESGLIPCVCNNIDELLVKIPEGCGAVLLAKEILTPSNLELLRHRLSQQMSWSDLPIVILASAGDLAQGKTETLQVLKSLRNTTVLERPIRVATFLSVLESTIANRKRQYEVRDLVHQLEIARQDAEFSKEESDHANKAKSEFLANMSHEIRTPLGIIIGFSGLAEEEGVTEEERKTYLKAIQRNGKVLLDLVNDILDLAKVEAGHMAIEEIETSPEAILHDIILGLSPSATAKNIKLVAKVASGIPAKLKTDPTRLRQIFMNVLGNAVKFTKYGSVTAELSSENIGNKKIRLSLTVTDTGLGISEHQVQKLFKPFSQADSSMAREYGGTGLGLILSRNLAKALGGSLELIESKKGVGSTFKITVVAKSATGDAIAAQDNDMPKETDFSGLEVLLADDSRDNQFLISKILKKHGVKVDFADNGLEAITKATNKNYDIILMDIQMPKMDGSKATSHLRKNGYDKPIIALTANALRGDKEKALAFGFDDYITKPIQQLELFNSLEKFIP